MGIFSRPQTDSDKLWDALWLHNSWHKDEAYRILNEVARNVERKKKVRYDGIKRTTETETEEEGVGDGDEDWWEIANDFR